MSELQLPEHWERPRLDDIATTSSGGTPLRARQEYFGGDIPWVKIGDLNDGVVSGSTEQITQKGLDESSARKLPAGTLLIAMYGSIGKLGILGIESATNQAICAIEVDKPLVPYLYWYLRYLRQQLVASGFGGTQSNISQTYLKGLAIPIPPLAEQQRIVAAIEAQIERIDEAEGALRVAKRLARQFSSSSLDEAFSIDRTANRPLGEVAVVQSGLAKKTSGASDRIHMPYISTANVQAGWLDLTNIKSIAVTPEQRVRHALRVGDVLVLEGGDADKVGRGWLWEGQVEECVHQNHVFAVRPEPDVLLPRFLAHYVNSPPARRYFLGAAKQTTNLASINKTQLNALPVPVPPIREQERILAVLEERLTSADEMTRALQGQEATVDSLRLSLLHRAFTGRLAEAGDDGESAAELVTRLRELVSSRSQARKRKPRRPKVPVA